MTPVLQEYDWSDLYFQNYNFLEIHCNETKFKIIRINAKRLHFPSQVSKKQWGLATISKILARKLKNKQTKGYLNVTRGNWR